MKVTGYMLREAIKQHELRRDTASRAFNGSLKKFPDEEKEPPHKVIETFTHAEHAIAALQEAQMRYNLLVEVEFDMPGNPQTRMSLAKAIKLVGGAGRVEKMWRSATGPKKDRYGGYRDDDEIDPTRIRAVSTITPSEAVKQATLSGKVAGALRAAIATANAVPIEIESLSPALFE